MAGGGGGQSLTLTPSLNPSHSVQDFTACSINEGKDRLKSWTLCDGLSEGDGSRTGCA